MYCIGNVLVFIVDIYCLYVVGNVVKMFFVSGVLDVYVFVFDDDLWVDCFKSFVLD